MKKLISIVLAICIIMSFTACKSNTVGTKENKKKSITICLDWTPNTNHTGIYVALANGYYKDAGLNVKVIQPPEDGASMMCAAGQAQFGIDFQDYLAPNFAAKEPMNVTAVAAVLQHNSSGILSRKGEGINTPKGLEGKKYSTWNLPIEQEMLKNVMSSDGADFSKVELIPNDITDEAAALKNHQTDAVWIYYGWGGINAEVSGLDFDYWSFIDLNPVFDYYTPVIIANNDYLKNNKEDAKKFLEATKKGYEYAVQNPEKAAQILIDGDDTGSLKGSEKLVKESQKWISKQYIADGAEWGQIDQSRWDNFYKWLWENKLIEKEIPAGFGFSNDYLN